MQSRKDTCRLYGMCYRHLHKSVTTWVTHTYIHTQHTYTNKEWIHTHTYIHTHIYIYIYMYMGKTVDR